ncbi:MAG: hypothetical protein P0Y60_00040 [Candidatus Microbacterium colombiense]|nr:MAG: hypothetical protein P0Y60_00040 [Microbacterium sp.]
MSEPQQPPVPSSASGASAAPPAATALPANPQYPASAQYPVSPQHPAIAPYPASTPPSASSPSSPLDLRPAPAGNALGRLALTIALLAVGMRLLTTLLYPLVYPGSDRMIAVFTFGSTAIALAGYIAALALGVIAARRPGSRLWAGIAIGLSAAYLLSLAIEWASSALYRFL